MNPSNPLSLDAFTRAAPLTSGAIRGGGQDFAAMIESAQSAPGRDEVREAADQLVSTAFILPLLEQVRSDPFKSDLFHGGRGEEVFGQQLDVIFADNITQSANFGISDALVRQFQNASIHQNQPQVNTFG